MEVITIESKIVEPSHDVLLPPPSKYTSLSIFDKMSEDTHIATIFAFRPPTPENAIIELGLQKVLSVYREYAGRFGKDENGEPVILLNDKGVRFVESIADTTLDQIMPLNPSPFLLTLHPSIDGVEELMQVQLTRFKCGSLVLGITHHHHVCDGHSQSKFYAAWGQATRGVDINPIPFLDRSIFTPRNPPRFEFEHKGVEYMRKTDKMIYQHIGSIANDIIVHKLNFTCDFLANLKARASKNSDHKSYTKFESLLAHLWRSITKVRGLSGNISTNVRIAVNGRTRMNPLTVHNYFGNIVLWAYPTSKVKDLLDEPISHAAKLIHDAVTKVNNDYFKSFIDFSNYKLEKEEEFTTTADPGEVILNPNIGVDDLVRFPFYDFDFGNGSPSLFQPSYLPVEGFIYLLPSFVRDGSIDVLVPLLNNVNSAIFKQICYSLDSRL